MSGKWYSNTKPIQNDETSETQTQLDQTNNVVIQ